jgi:hypothetical protein
MKKTILIAALVLAALTVTGVGIAFAQGGLQPNYNGMMHNGQGPLHTFMVTEFAKKFELNVNDVNTRLANGERLYEIALSTGVAEEDLPALMEEVHSNALDAAVKANVITQAQADAMKERGFGRGGMGNCHGDQNQSGFQKGFGPGMMVPKGRWNQQTAP